MIFPRGCARAFGLLAAIAGLTANSADLSKNRTVLDRLKPERLDAVRQQRVEWMKTREVAPPHGVYNEYRVVARPCGIAADALVKAAVADGVHGLICTDGRVPSAGSNDGRLLVLSGEGLKLPEAAGLTDLLKSAGLDPAKWKRLAGALTNYPDEFLGAGEIPVEVNPVAAALVAGKKAAESIWKPALRNSSLRVFAHEPGEIRQALAEGRFNSARDWLCDPAGFYFWASSNLGVYNVGDSIPLVRAARIEARSPVPATFRLYQDDKLLHESTGKEFKHPVPGPGTYRMEALLRVDGEERPWISTGTIRASTAPAVTLPSYKVDESVEQIKDISYVENGDAKQRLDVYLPRAKRDFPVFVFVHGGSWSSGDKSVYVPIGNMFAKMGIGVVIPSYRLMPAHKHPAQVEDVAAAWAWVVKNMAIRYGADPQRLYLGGHSAGGHLVSLLALDPRYVERHAVTTATIKGVAALSGVYDMRAIPIFGSTVDERKQASPLEFVRRDAPPFVVSYCQWDYLFLPLQAKEFTAKLRESFVDARLVYVPGESHISEVIAMLAPGDPTTKAIVEMIGPGAATAAN